MFDVTQVNGMAARASDRGRHATSAWRCVVAASPTSTR
jgi:hypothetical protein